jgi:predicted PurR-regulated permease PerM
VVTGRARSIQPAVIAAAGGVLLLIGLHLAAGVVALVALSVLVTVLLVPIRTWLVSRSAPGWLALLVCLALYVGVLAVAGMLLLIGIGGFLVDLPTYRDALEARLADLGVDPEGDGGLADGIEDVARGLADEILGGLATIGYSIFIVAYMLLEGPSFPAKLRRAFGPDTTTVGRGSDLADRLRTYIVARAILGSIAAVLDTILLLALGVPSALLWGVLSFLLSFVPNVGFILALIPPTFLAFILDGPLAALAVVVGYSVINIAIDYVVQPRFVGSEVDLSPVVVTVSLLFWALVLGGAGAILAVPMTIVAAAAFDAFEDSRPLSVLVGDPHRVPPS